MESKLELQELETLKALVFGFLFVAIVVFSFLIWKLWQISQIDITTDEEKDEEYEYRHWDED